jgi:hypothetical protein
MLPPNLAGSGLAAGTGWRVEPAGSDSFLVFLGREPVYFAADYLAWSDQFAPEFDLIRKALQRPCSRMDGDYQRPFEIPLVNFVNVRNMAQTAAQRAQCCLLLRRPEQAFRELSLNFELRRLLASKSTLLVAAMIDVAIAGLDAGVIADGLRLQAWREPELIALQEQLQQVRLLQSVAVSFQTERAAACHTLETTSARDMAKLLSFGRPEEGFWKRVRNPVYLLLKLAPRGWVYLNLTTIATLQQQSVAIFGPQNQTLAPRQAAAVTREFQEAFSHWSPNNVLAAVTLPNFIRATQTTAQNQTWVNQALVVCGLERYRLAHGGYPESLDALVPQFVEALPSDVIGGQPLKYRRTEGGKFLLYSIGWNEWDEGGESSTDREKGDWVWSLDQK